MANKREFKKYVEALGASACDAMMSSYYNVKGADKDAIEKALGMVLGAVGEARANSNITFEKGVKAFDSLKDYSAAKAAFNKKLFEKIVSDFSSKLDAALKIFNAAIPQEVKEYNKKALEEAK